MSNIIPLPFESTLAASYTDASELVQAMQHLERHLAHIINIWVTSKFCIAVIDLMLTMVFYRFAGVLAGSVGGGTSAHEGVDGALGAGESSAGGDDGAAAPCAQL